jgi:hypothetical protein
MSGFWQIKMDVRLIAKTAFVTEYGLHEFWGTHLGCPTRWLLFRVRKLYIIIYQKII